MTQYIFRMAVLADKPAIHSLQEQSLARTKPASVQAAASPAVTPPPASSAPTVEPPATTGVLCVTVKGAWADVWVDGKMLPPGGTLHRPDPTRG